MRVSEAVHTPAVTCRPGTTLREVAGMMERHDVGCVLVVALGAVIGRQT